MLFLYLDESGNYTFSKNGSEFLIYTSIITPNPYTIHHKLCNLELEFKRKNIPLQSGYFHATEDKQIVRDQVYNVLKMADPFDIDSVIVEKCKANPSIREPVNLYRKVYHVLIRYVLKYREARKIIIFIHSAPVQKKREAIEKGIKETLSEILGKGIMYHISYLPSIASYGLQAVDYCGWALKKKYGDWGDKIDDRPYNEIKHRIRSEFDIFATGDGHKYY